MKYFIVSVDRRYVAPSPVGWQGVLDRKSLENKKASQMPKHLLFPVESHMQMMVTDVITFPCFMVSEMGMKVINKYDPFIKFVRILLFDKQNKRSIIYYLPFLDEIQCAADGKRDLLILEEDQMGERPIGEIRDYRGKIRVVMRMDLVESMLRRDAVGIGLEEIKVNGNIHQA